MKLLQKYTDVLIALVLVLLLGLIPVFHFVRDMMDYINTYGDSDLGLGLIDMWQYLLWVVDNTWFIVLLPVILPILTTYSYHKQYHRGNRSQLPMEIKQSFLRAISLVFGYSGLLFIISVFLPTASTNFEIDQPFVWIVFFHMNIALFSIFITSLGLIMMTLIERYFLAFVATVGSFIVITFFFIALGGVFDGVFPEPFNGDWFWIYNALQFDSGMPEYFGFAFIVVLSGISIIVFRQLLQNKE